LHYRQIDSDLERSALCWRCLVVHPANESARGTNPTRPASTQMDSRPRARREQQGDCFRPPARLDRMYLGTDKFMSTLLRGVAWNSREIAVSSRPETASQVPIRARTFHTFALGAAAGTAAPRFRQRRMARSHVFGPYKPSRARGQFLHSDGCAQTPGMTLVLTGERPAAGTRGGWSISQRAIRPIRR